MENRISFVSMDIPWETDLEIWKNIKSCFMIIQDFRVDLSGNGTIMEFRKRIKTEISLIIMAVITEILQIIPISVWMVC